MTFGEVDVIVPAGYIRALPRHSYEHAYEGLLGDAACVFAALPELPAMRESAAETVRRRTDKCA
jgi:hypothetical protein